MGSCGDLTIFFQAEDGIRDLAVTGVQTCALPIYVGHIVLPDILAHRYFGDFEMTSFKGFAKLHSLELDLGDPYRGGPLWLLMHGEIEYFTATGMYAADQAGIQGIAPYVEALGPDGRWTKVIDDLGFPAGGARTMTADLSGKLRVGTKRIRITTNLQI